MGCIRKCGGCVRCEEMWCVLLGIVVVCVKKYGWLCFEVCSVVLGSIMCCVRNYCGLC